MAVGPHGISLGWEHRLRISHPVLVSTFTARTRDMGRFMVIVWCDLIITKEYDREYYD